MKHESCQNSVKIMKHFALPPYPPLQINRKIRKGSKQTMKTPDDDILEVTKG